MHKRQQETRRVRRLYDDLAEQYDRVIRVWEKLLFGHGRAWIGAQARGTVLEIALGTGRNLPFYPPDVQITGIELSAAMLAIARHRAIQTGRPIALCLGDAQLLPFPDASFDTVVATLAFCTIPDDRQALRETVRVLRPAG